MPRESLHLNHVDMADTERKIYIDSSSKTGGGAVATKSYSSPVKKDYEVGRYSRCGTPKNMKAVVPVEIKKGQITL